MKPTVFSVGFCFWMQDKMKIDLRLGDCLEVMKTLQDNSVDAVVCDPPYELGFMGKSWDRSGIAYNVELWRQVLRVLKPGGHLLAFGGSRTYHRMAVAIEDAGFEVRDQIMWLYSQGFPKSHSISKAIDRMAGAEREIVGPKITGDGHIQNRKNGKNEYGTFKIAQDGIDMETAPATPAAAQWEGWGTALKPAHEPICVARKPLSEKTVAENVLKWGTGGLNIDGCRVSYLSEKDKKEACSERPNAKNHNVARNVSFGFEGNDSLGNRGCVDGRFPANLIHDGSDEVLAGFPDTKSGSGDKNSIRSRSNDFLGMKRDYIYPSNGGDTGSAARFFYCAKASKKDRDEGCEGLDEREARVTGMQSDQGMPVRMENGVVTGAKAPPKMSRNTHPTVKPTALMRYLCRLVTPPNGVVLDPFMGSGSTGKGAALEGFDFIGIEKEAEYFEIAKARIAAAQDKPKQEDMIG
jgi:DNA modification methylase